MLARRLLIALAVLMGLTALAAGVAPRQPLPGRFGAEAGRHAAGAAAGGAALGIVRLGHGRGTLAAQPMPGGATEVAARASGAVPYAGSAGRSPGRDRRIVGATS